MHRSGKDCEGEMLPLLKYEDGDNGSRTADSVRPRASHPRSHCSNTVHKEMSQHVQTQETSQGNTWGGLRSRAPCPVRSKFADDTESGGVADTQEGRARLQNNLGGVENPVCNPSDIHQAQGQSLAPGTEQLHPRTQTGERQAWVQRCREGLRGYSGL